MRAVTIREAKARLNELVEAATQGEQVVIMRRSKHVAAIVPLSADELELPPRLADAQAERLWRSLAAERAERRTVVFRNPTAAIAHLSRSRRRTITRSRPARRRKRQPR
jgi:prevent-host-death family protein